MLFLVIVSVTFYMGHYYFISAMKGLMMNFLILIRSIVYVNNDKNWAKNINWLYFFMILIWVLGLITFNAWYDVLPLFGITAQTIAFWSKKPSTIRSLYLINMPFWFTYNYLVGSIAGMTSDILITISILIGIFRLDMHKNWSFPSYASGTLRFRASLSPSFN